MKEQSRHAQAAKMIKQELKKVFPETQFSVKARSFSMGTSVDISWIDGPMRDTVQMVTSKYQYGHFDGQTDTYEYSNTHENLPQVKYVQHHHEISDAVYQEKFNELKKTHAHFNEVKSLDETSQVLFDYWRFWTARNYIQMRCFS